MNPVSSRCAPSTPVVIAGAAGLAMVGLAVRYRQWGSTRAERTALLPGDELIADPGRRITFAVSIDATPEDVWPWLIQIGQDRGGMYSYDGVENLVGLDVHSAATIHPEWQDRAVGDRVVLMRPGWMGITEGYSLPIAMIEPSRALVLRQQPPEHPWDAVWSFVLIPEGERGCRLLSRSLSARQPGPGGWLAALVTEWMHPMTMIMTRRMLLGVRDRAEGGGARRRPRRKGTGADGAPVQSPVGTTTTGHVA